MSSKEYFRLASLPNFGAFTRLCMLAKTTSYVVILKTIIIATAFGYLATVASVD